MGDKDCIHVIYYSLDEKKSMYNLFDYFLKCNKINKKERDEQVLMNI